MKNANRFLFIALVLLFWNCQPENHQCFKSNGEDTIVTIHTESFNKISIEDFMYVELTPESIAEQKKKAFETMAPCIPCNRPHSDNGTMLPERYVVKCDTVSCQRKEVDKNGLGDGRNFM